MRCKKCIEIVLSLNSDTLAIINWYAAHLMQCVWFVNWIHVPKFVKNDETMRKGEILWIWLYTEWRRKRLLNCLKRDFHWALNMFPSVRNSAFNWTNCSLTNISLLTFCICILDLNSSCTRGKCGIFQSHLLSRRSNKGFCNGFLYSKKCLQYVKVLQKVYWLQIHYTLSVP